MKKTIFLLTSLFCFGLMFGQQEQVGLPVWNGNSPTVVAYRFGNVGIGFTSVPSPSTAGLMIKVNGLEGLPLQMGKYLSTPDQWNFNFGISADFVGTSIYDPDQELRSAFSATSDHTFQELYNASGANFYKVSSGTSLGTYIHLPQSNSKIIIGGYADYPASADYMFYVKGGDAKVEGNFIADGDIGIGTDSFDDGSTHYRLSIDGKMRADAVRVYTDWADFVFKTDYELDTLKEVEAFIAENGHLKNIPNAEEVETSGIDLGEMNKLLLQKVEELTLYLIEKDKQIEALQKDVAELKAQ